MSLEVTYDQCEIDDFDAGGEDILTYQGILLTGYIVEYYPDGVTLLCKNEYKSGHKHGKQISYHPNGQTMEEYNIKFNRIYGWFREFNDAVVETYSKDHGAEP